MTTRLRLLIGAVGAMKKGIVYEARTGGMTPPDYAKTR